MGFIKFTFLFQNRMIFKTDCNVNHWLFIKNKILQKRPGEVSACKHEKSMANRIDYQCWCVHLGGNQYGSQGINRFRGKFISNHLVHRIEENWVQNEKWQQIFERKRRPKMPFPICLENKSLLLIFNKYEREHPEIMST